MLTTYCLDYELTTTGPVMHSRLYFRLLCLDSTRRQLCK